jgi:hypothetical protein
MTATGDLSVALKAATDLAQETGFRPTTFEEFATFAVAGQLTHSFPLDEYAFDFGARLVEGAADTKATLPLTIFKRNSGRAVAIVDLHVPNSPDYWETFTKEFQSRIGFLR